VKKGLVEQMGPEKGQLELVDQLRLAQEVKKSLLSSLGLLLEKGQTNHHRI
jgi:hypothetical protein